MNRTLFYISLLIAALCFSSCSPPAGSLKSKDNFLSFGSSSEEKLLKSVYPEIEHIVFGTESRIATYAFPHANDWQIAEITNDGNICIGSSELSGKDLSRELVFHVPNGPLTFDREPGERLFDVLLPPRFPYSLNRTYYCKKLDKYVIFPQENKQLAMKTSFWRLGGKYQIYDRKTRIATSLRPFVRESDSEVVDFIDGMSFSNEEIEYLQKQYQFSPWTMTCKNVLVDDKVYILAYPEFGDGGPCHFWRLDLNNLRCSSIPSTTDSVLDYFNHEMETDFIDREFCDPEIRDDLVYSSPFFEYPTSAMDRNTRTVLYCYYDYSEKGNFFQLVRAHGLNRSGDKEEPDEKLGKIPVSEFSSKPRTKYDTYSASFDEHNNLWILLNESMESTILTGYSSEPLKQIISYSLPFPCIQLSKPYKGKMVIVHPVCYQNAKDGVKYYNMNVIDLRTGKLLLPYNPLVSRMGYPYRRNMVYAYPVSQLGICKPKEVRIVNLQSKEKVHHLKAGKDEVFYSLEYREDTMQWVLMSEIGNNVQVLTFSRDGSIEKQSFPIHSEYDYLHEKDCKVDEKLLGLEGAKSLDDGADFSDFSIWNGDSRWNLIRNGLIRLTYRDDAVVDSKLKSFSTYEGYQKFALENLDWIRNMFSIGNKWYFSVHLKEEPYSAIVVADTEKKSISRISPPTFPNAPDESTDLRIQAKYMPLGDDRFLIFNSPYGDNENIFRIFSPNAQLGNFDNYTLVDASPEFLCFTDPTQPNQLFKLDLRDSNFYTFNLHPTYIFKFNMSIDYLVFDIPQEAITCIGKWHKVTPKPEMRKLLDAVSTLVNQ